MVKIIERYIPYMFGSDVDEYGEKYIDAYKYEFKNIVDDIRYCKSLNLTHNQLEGCLIYNLSRILSKGSLEKFRGKWLKWLCFSFTN